MDAKEKRRSILKHRRHEVSKEYARRREMEGDKGLFLDTDEVTISIENLQAHLYSLTKDITLEKHQRLIADFKDFFDLLGDDKTVLFEMINTYKNKGSLPGLDVDSSTIQILRDKVQKKIPSIKTDDIKEFKVETTTSLETWNKFNDMVQRTGLNQTDCFTLALRLFVDYCSKILAEGKQQIPSESKSASARIFKKL